MDKKDVEKAALKAGKKIIDHTPEPVKEKVEEKVKEKAKEKFVEKN
ncbi:hypothetical protein [Priestia aryabhattai]|nr:hypothetical protein [Priestia aryabhattai]